MSSHSDVPCGCGSAYFIFGETVASCVKLRSRANGSYHSCHSRVQRGLMDRLSHKRVRHENKSAVRSAQSGDCDFVIAGSLCKNPWWGASSKYNSQVPNGQKRSPALYYGINADDRTKSRQEKILKCRGRMIARDLKLSTD